jgi:hypothetical protein
VLYNSDTGLAGGARQQLTQADAAGAVESGDRFGAALSGPFLHESDALEDLGIGAPGEPVGGAAGAGAVSVLPSPDPEDAPQALGPAASSTRGTRRRNHPSSRVTYADEMNGLLMRQAASRLSIGATCCRRGGR